MIPMTCKSKLAIEGATSVAEYLQLFYGEVGSGDQQSLGLNLVVSDGIGLAATEGCPGDRVIAYPDAAVRTNTYLTEEWQPLLNNATFSKDRQAGAENRLQAVRQTGDFTENALWDLLTEAPLFARQASGPIDTETLAFFSSQFFGLGSPAVAPRVPVPI
jgi:hypothetical protein